MCLTVWHMYYDVLCACVDLLLKEIVGANMLCPQLPMVSYVLLKLLKMIGLRMPFNAMGIRDEHTALSINAKARSCTKRGGTKISKSETSSPPGRRRGGDAGQKHQQWSPVDRSCLLLLGWVLQTALDFFTWHNTNAAFILGSRWILLQATSKTLGRFI